MPTHCRTLDSSNALALAVVANATMIRRLFFRSIANSCTAPSPKQSEVRRVTSRTGRCGRAVFAFARLGGCRALG
ncbi:hypothetical protein EVAR_90854_1 [Eumeta japonica]|uniref:Uncharacterized protein n=1 Tax=Eumeta variegata TaxID=151549 RepID=A0A4C1ZWF7_EUMVA|nr:hypothetical protein EVAR_90854_1 [Eumeta japonica]